MKAARFHGRNDIRIDHIAALVLEPGAVAIKIAWCGICGTDLHEYIEGPIFIPPTVHPLTDLAVGENVVVERRWVHPSGSIPLDQAALIEPLSVGHHAFVRSGAKKGDVAPIGGAGPIGLFLAAVLKAEGMTVFISEPSAARKAKAISTGVADRVLDPTTGDIVARVLDITGGVGVDVGFECSSINAVLTQLFDAVRPAGVIVNVSIWSTPETIDMQKLVLKQIDLRGIIAYCNDHPATIELVQHGKVSLTHFITVKIPLDRLIDEGFDTLINHKETAVKITGHP